MKGKLTERIFVIVRGVTLGEGEGNSIGRAKNAAAAKALGYLDREGLPQLQA